MANSPSPGFDWLWRAGRRAPGKTLLALLLGAGGAIAADQAIAPFDCVGAVCGFNVLARELRVAPCHGQSLLMAYSTASGLALLQCSTPGDPVGNASLLFDRANPTRPGLALQGTRFVKPDALAEASRDGVPDRFGSVPLCAGAGGAEAGSGELLLLKKRPSADAAEGACYALLRARLVAGEPVVRGPSGEPIAAGTAPVAIDRWQALLAGLLPWLSRVADGAAPPTPAAAPRLSAAAPAAVTMLVRQARAGLFEHADARSSQRRYLVEGDRVQVLDDSRRAEGWLRVRHVGRNGRVLDAWMQASMLAPLPQATETSATP